MRKTRALAACVLGLLGVSSCGEFPTLTLGELKLTPLGSSMATTVNRPVVPFKPASASGGSDAYSYAVSGLPTGLVMDANTGMVSGTPEEAVVSRPLNVTVTDVKQSGVTASATYSAITVNAALAATPVQAYANVRITQGAAFTPFTPLTVTGGTPPLAYTLSGAAVPPGLTITGSPGVIGGTATTSNGTPAVVTVTATDAAGATTSANFNIRVNVPLTTSLSPIEPACTTNVPCSNAPVVPAGGTTPYTYVVTPALPTGLSLIGGAITGTSTSSVASSGYRITVTDSANATSFKDFQFKVSQELDATAIVSKNCTQNTNCAFTPVEGSGGTAPLTYSSTTLPIGLIMNAANGAIAGTPTGTQAESEVTVTVKDAANATVSRKFKLTVNPPITITPGVTTKVCTQGSPCIAQPSTASNGSPPYTYSVSPALPAGLSINVSTGQITGPATASSAAAVYTIAVTDVNNAPAGSRQLTLTVNPPLTTALGLPAYTCTVNATLCAFTPVTPLGGTPPYTYTLSPASSTLPTGLSFDVGTGAISGIPTASLSRTTFTVTVKDGATDSPQATSSKSFDFTVSGPVSARLDLSLVTSTVNVPFSTAFPSGVRPVVGSGGTGTLTYTVLPVLPNGLIFNATTGVITGTPTTIGNTAHEVSVSDQAAGIAKQTFTLNINGPIVPTILASKSCTQGAPCMFTAATVIGGTQPYTYTVQPALPAGLTLVGNGASAGITGSPNAPLAATPFTITVRDQANATSSGPLVLTVNSPVVATQAVADIACGDLNGCAPALPQSPVTATGGTAPITFGLSTGNSPAGLTYNTSTGVLSGTPATSFAYATITASATDVNGSSNSKTFTLSVLQSALTSATQVCGINLTCSLTPVTANGGKAPYTYALTGALPNGLTFSPSTGTISGTATVSQSPQPHEITVQDNAGRQSKKPFTLEVGAPPLSTTLVHAEIGCSDLSGCTTSIPFTPVTVPLGSSGVGTLSYALTGGTLPTGLSFNATNGEISGTLPTSALATTTFTVTVTDQNAPIPQTSSKAFNLSVLLTTATGANSCTSNGSTACSMTPVTSNGGKGTIVWSVTSGSAGLTALGLTLNTSTGAITGTPTATGTASNVTIAATDALNRISSKTVTITVVAPSLTTAQAIAEYGCDDQSGCSPAIPSIPVSAAGGFGAKTFALTGGALPGLSFNTSTGQISGPLPTSALTSTTFTVTVTDQTTPTAQTSSKTFLLSALATAASGPVSCTTGAACSIIPVVGTGGKGTLAWSVSGADLAALQARGLDLNPTNGAIFGAAPTAGSVPNITITVTDALGRQSSRTVTITVAP